MITKNNTDTRMMTDLPTLFASAFFWSFWELLTTSLQNETRKMIPAIQKIWKHGQKEEEKKSKKKKKKYELY